MTNAKTVELSLSEPLKSSYSSQQFWLCNILGWLAFALTEGIRNSFDGSPLTANLFNYLPTALLGLLGGLCVRFLHKKYRWHTHHPMRLIPAASLIAIIFGVFNVTLNHVDLAFSITEICARDYPRPPHNCGMLSDLFLQSMGAMQVWCLFYFLIKAEKNPNSKTSYNLFSVGKSLFCLCLLNYLATHLSVIAWVDWGDTYYLFSKDYFINAISLFLPILSTTYILLIRLNLQFCNSKTLPIIPILFVVSFCCATFNIGAGGIITRLEYLPDNWTFHYVLFGENYGNFSHPNVLAGALDGTFVSILSMTLFYLIYRHKSNQQTMVIPQASRILFKKALTSWGYYFSYWLFFGLLIYAIDIMDWAYFGKSVPTTNTLSFTVAGAFIGAVLRLQMLYFATQKTSIMILAFKIVAASIFAGILLSSTIWLVSYTYIFVVLNGYNIKQFSSFAAVDNFIFANLLATSILCGLWSFICYMIESMRLHSEAAINQLQLEKNMKDVQLNALAGRIDPHFIFNALNNIRALVNEDSEKARSAIAVLSDILRSPLAKNSQDKIPITEELLLVKNYVLLSKIQLEDRLEYKEEVSEGVNCALIPSMMLQILVENAIKHGISQLADGGTLIVKIARDKDQLICQVTNHGSLHGPGNTEGFGIGISAVRERLNLLYPANANFSLREIDNTVIAELILPFECAP
jgi:signal transduction histidine kinase